VQVIGALKQLEAGRKAEDVAREVGVSKHTIYAWKAKYGGMDVSEAQEAKQLRDENTRVLLSPTAVGKRGDRVRLQASFFVFKSERGELSMNLAQPSLRRSTPASPDRMRSNPLPYRT
jgi:hypothetical protein